MSEIQVSNISGAELEELIGKEVKVKVKGILPMWRGICRDCKEFVLDVLAVPEKNDYLIIFLLMRTGKRKHNEIYHGYYRPLSQVHISPVVDGQELDMHSPDIVKAHEFYLNNRSILFKM